MYAIHRVVDANFNRAAEGMRVLEDIARFVLENKHLCGEIKNCRHELRIQSLQSFSRDTDGDVGTEVTTKQENDRNSLHDVAIAAGNRTAEALRVLEELLKLESQQNTIEEIRYKMYDFATGVLQGLGATTKKQWKLCFVMTKNECVLAWQDAMVQSIAAGCDCVQVREKELTTRDVIKHVLDVKEIADKYNVSVIVNDRIDVVLATGASGVHLGKNDMPIQDARKLCGSQYIIGATVHPEDEVPYGADYIGVGSMFASKTKPDVQVASIGLLKNALSYNHLAIGGITPKNVQTLYKIGCKGIAVSSAIAQSTTPGRVVEQLLQHEAQPA